MGASHGVRTIKPERARVREPNRSGRMIRLGDGALIGQDAHPTGVTSRLHETQCGSHLTPAVVHAGRAAEVTAARAITLTRASKAHPERFVRRPPTPPEVPTAVWINPRAKREEESPQ